MRTHLQSFSLLACLAAHAGCASAPAPEPLPAGPAAQAPSTTPALPESIPLLNELRRAIRDGTPEDKERALQLVRELKAIQLIPEVIAAIADPTSLPRHGDTGWGFVGHQAASIMGELAMALDRFRIDGEEKRRAYSFFDDSYLGGERLRESGRLEEVRRNWSGWQDKRAGRR